MTLKLTAKTRKLFGKKNYLLRQEGKVPGVIYGHGSENKNIEMDAINFDKIYDEAGGSSLIDLVVDDTDPFKAIIADVQTDPVSQKNIHVDFHQIKMDEKINVEVPINIFGESAAVKDGTGILVQSINEIEIKCLPNDLIHEIDLDISILKEIGDSIAIKDLNLAENVEIIGHELEDVVVGVIEQREEQVAPATEPTEDVATADAGTGENQANKDSDNKEGGAEPKNDKK